jgi:hypothetical protein
MTPSGLRLPLRTLVVLGALQPKPAREPSR